MYYAYKKIKKHRAQKAAEATAAAAVPSAAAPVSVAVSDTDKSTTPSTAVAKTTPTTTPIPKKKCPQCTKEKSATRKYRWKLLFCLLPAFFCASLDLTIVATALPQIASHFGQFPLPQTVYLALP